MSFLISIAMREELPEDVLIRYRDALPLLIGVKEAVCAHRTPVEVIVTGVGKVAAASVVSAAIAAGRGGSGVVSVGYCAGLSDELRLGDVFVPASLFQYDYGARTTRGEWWARPGDRTLRYEKAPFESVLYLPANRLVTRLLAACSAVDIPVVRGRLASGDRFVTDPEFGALFPRFASVAAIDMESAAVAQACDLHGVPFAAARVVSDTCGSHAEAQYRKTLESPSAHYGAIFGSIIEEFLTHVGDATATNDV